MGLINLNLLEIWSIHEMDCPYTVTSGISLVTTLHFGDWW